MNRDISIAIEILEEIKAESGSAGRILKRHFRKHPDLDNPRRARIARDVYGVRCHLRRLDYLLSKSELPQNEAHRIAAYRINIDKEDPADFVEIFDNDSWKTFAQDTIDWPSEPQARLAIEHSLPDFVAARLLKQFGEEEAAQLAAALNQPGPITIRARKFKQDRDDLSLALAEKGIMAMACTRARNGLHLHSKPDIRGCELWKAGKYEVQDEGSQLVAQVLEPQPGETILDLCAGAGGKSLAIADLMNEEGRVIASDINEQRLHDLQVRIGRTQITCIEPVLLPANQLPENVDAVLVDAPCSSTGTWRRGPDRKWTVREEDLVDFARLQLELLHTGWNSLRAGGRLVYATCSLLEDENEAVIKQFEKEASGVTHSHQESLLPHRHNTDGFFISVFKK